MSSFPRVAVELPLLFVPDKEIEYLEHILNVEMYIIYGQSAGIRQMPQIRVQSDGTVYVDYSHFEGTSCPAFCVRSIEIDELCCIVRSVLECLLSSAGVDIPAVPVHSLSASASGSEWRIIEKEAQAYVKKHRRRLKEPTGIFRWFQYSSWHERVLKMTRRGIIRRRKAAKTKNREKALHKFEKSLSPLAIHLMEAICLETAGRAEVQSVEIPLSFTEETTLYINDEEVKVVISKIRSDGLPMEAMFEWQPDEDMWCTVTVCCGKLQYLLPPLKGIEVHFTNRSLIITAVDPDVTIGIDSFCKEVLQYYSNRQAY